MGGTEAVVGAEVIANQKLSLERYEGSQADLGCRTRKGKIGFIGNVPKLGGRFGISRNVLGCHS